MKPSTKDRLILSATGGLIIPTVYFLLLLFVQEVFQSLISPTIQWLALPLTWPAFLYEFLFPVQEIHSDFEMPDMSGVVIELLLVVVGNFLLYSLLTYLLIGRWQRMPRLP